MVLFPSSHFRRAISAVLALAWLCATGAAWLQAEEGVEITTNDKRYYLGVIVSEDDQNIVVRDSQGGKSQISKKNIAERLALQDPNDRRRELESLFDTRLEAMDKTDAKGYYELGHWAKQRGMKKQAEQAFREVMRVDPSHNGAAQELGWKQVNGKFVDPATIVVSDPAATDLNVVLGKFDPDAAQASETGMPNEDPAVVLVKNDPKFRVNLYRIVKTAPAAPAQKELRRKAILLIGKSRRFDMITGLLEILLTDPEAPTVQATAKALKYMKYDGMATILADLAALNRVEFYRARALYGLAILEDTAGIDRLLFHAGFQVAGGVTADVNNPLIQVGGDELDPTTFMQTRQPATGPINPNNQTQFYPALDAIKRLSGKDFKADLANWRLWWTTAQKQFKFIVPEIK